MLKNCGGKGIVTQRKTYCGRQKEQKKMNISKSQVWAKFCKVNKNNNNKGGRGGKKERNYKAICMCTYTEKKK